MGLVGACELVRDKETKQAFDARLALGAKCMGFCQDRGLIVRAIGDAVAVCPPFIVTEDRSTSYVVDARVSLRER